MTQDTYTTLNRMLDRLLKWVTLVLLISIPMQYRFHKMLKPLAFFLAKQDLTLPTYFEKMVFFCISDVCIVLLFCILIAKRSIAWKRVFVEGSAKYLTLYFIVALLSLAFSNNKDYFLQYFRLWQLLWIGLVFYFLANGSLGTDSKKLIKRFFWIVALVSLFESGVAIMQYFTQHEVGLKKLGELNLSSPSRVPATFEMSDGSLWIFDHLFSASKGIQGVMRAYGTLPDPNILGGFLVLATMASFYLFIQSTTKAKKAIISFMIFLQIIALTVSFSRSAFFALILASGLFFSLFGFRILIMKKERDLLLSLKSVLAVFFTSLCVSMILFYPQLVNRGGVISYSSTAAEYADAERSTYQDIAAHIIQQRPLTGVGFNNYSLEMKQFSEEKLPYNYSHPVHNIFLLIASESGLLAVGAFIMFLFSAVYAMVKKGLTDESIALVSIFCAFLFIGLCSHYFLTWHQGKLMLFIVMGLIALTGKKTQEEKMQSNAGRISVSL